MTDDPDPRSFDREALKDALWAEGVSDDRAEAWIARWEAEAAPPDKLHDEGYWRLAAEWIDRARRAS